jgi:hypothetical protein
MAQIIHNGLRVDMQIRQCATAFRRHSPTKPPLGYRKQATRHRSLLFKYQISIQYNPINHYNLIATKQVSDSKRLPTTPPSR